MEHMRILTRAQASMDVLRQSHICASTVQVWRRAAREIAQAITPRCGSMTAPAMQAPKRGQRQDHARRRSGYAILSSSWETRKVSEAWGDVRRLALAMWGIFGIYVGRKTLHLRSMVENMRSRRHLAQSSSQAFSSERPATGAQPRTSHGRLSEHSSLSLTRLRV